MRSLLLRTAFRAFLAAAAFLSLKALPLDPDGVMANGDVKLAFINNREELGVA